MASRMCYLVKFLVVGLLFRVLFAADTNSIVFDGTSITRGSGAPAGRAYPDQLLEVLGPLWGGTNIAVRGQKGDQMIADFSSQVAPLFNPSVSQAIVFDMGINDLTAGDAVDVVKSRYDDYFSLCAQAGWPTNRIFVLPIGPSYFAGNFSTATRTDVNNYLLSQYPHSTIDPAWEPRIFATGANLNTNLFTDLTHPNEVGCALQAAVVKRKMVIEGFLPPVLTISIYEGITLEGAVGATYRVETSTNGIDWTTRDLVTLAKSPQIWASDATIVGQRQHYRASLVE